MNEPDQKVLVIPRLRRSQAIIKQWWNDVNKKGSDVPTAYSLEEFFYTSTGRGGVLVSLENAKRQYPIRKFHHFALNSVGIVLSEVPEVGKNKRLTKKKKV